MNLLVAGLGYVGTALFERLERTEHTPWGLRRHPPPNAPERIIAANATTGEGLEKIPHDVSQIAIAISPDERSDEGYQRAYPLAVQTLSQRFPDARLLLVSSTGVYDQSNGEIVDDTSLADASAVTSRRILEAENAVLSHGKASCVLRASGIYGPGRTRLISQLAHSATPTDLADTWTNRIHRDDLVGAIGFLIQRPQLEGRFVVSDPTPVTLGALGDWVSQHPKSKALPSTAPPGNRRRKNRRFAPTRLLHEGFSFRYPSYQEGYGEILESLDNANGKRI